jgi:hypothetical protein
MTWDWVVPVAVAAGFVLLWAVILPRLGVKT